MPRAASSQQVSKGVGTCRLIHSSNWNIQTATLLVCVAKASRWQRVKKSGSLSTCRCVSKGSGRKRGKVAVLRKKLPPGCWYTAGCRYTRDPQDIGQHNAEQAALNGKAFAMSIVTNISPIKKLHLHLDSWTPSSPGPAAIPAAACVTSVGSAYVACCFLVWTGTGLCMYM
eukprot:CAMPEP_0197862884 /NCGR_PEP_ID=MMETSP1438-20131217/39961_1 /TAXON_ID=1461541 /ORGANISM="Pterosperma sp., Strain CCMP1384" /LENGTH=170 /DNA_ID=CAMNT_0043480593 /DNA_START=254 /DNA_END=766 /DNA_ORIENTATION=-